MAFDSTPLDIDPEAVAKRIEKTVRKQIPGTLRRKGAVVAVSGGIDSSVCAALCARAVGGERVLALSLPERDSSAESTQLVQLLVATAGIRHLTHNITPILEAAGCYDRQEEAIRTVFPEYGPGWKCKIVMPPMFEGKRLNISRLEVEDPTGKRTINRLSAAAYLQLVAATNFKQRVRSMIAYYHADRLNYAVCGTPNRLEYDQGFFVKGGDGLADFKPIAHLYKTQVYQLGRFLGVPEGILCRPPTTETFSLTQSQEEFYFGLPYRILDVCLYAYNHDTPPVEAAEATGLTPEQVERVYADIQSKRRHTAPLHLGSLLCEELSGAGTPGYSHAPRWRTTAMLKRFFSPEVRGVLASQLVPDVLDSLPESFMKWDELARAQYLECVTLLSSYLLSSQGDRMLMAHSVEGRFPFLDNNVVEFCNSLPALYKLPGLNEKSILKRMARGLVPELIVSRPKQPYRAPDAVSFLAGGVPEYVAEAFSEAELKRSGLFDPGPVCMLYKKCLKNLTGPVPEFSNVDNMAFVGVLSTQLLWKQFVENPIRPAAINKNADFAVSFSRMNESSRMPVPHATSCRST